MEPMKSILIAYDGSECADAIITELRHVGLPAQLEVYVISVEETFLVPISDPGMWAPFPAIMPSLPSAADVNAQLAEKAADTAAKGAEKIRAAFPSWMVSSIGKVESVARAIMLRASDVSADIIFIGSHSRSAVGRFFLGSVSHKVAAEAKCGVHICRPHAPFGGTPRVVVAVDGSVASTIAVNAIIDREWPADTLVAVVSVIESPFRGTDFSGEFSDPWLRVRLGEPTTERDKRLAELEKVAEAAHRKIHLAGINCESHTLVGPPKQTLLEWTESWKADCIFIGASGTQHPGTEAFGTVASAISVRAHCSVEIARNRPAEIIANGPAL